MPDNNNNPSVVTDESGGNYGGIKQNADPLGSVQAQYLQNLWRMAQEPVKAPLTPAQEFPTLSKGIQVGTSSTETLGSQPIFGVGGGVVSMAGIDAMKKARKQAEIDYYKSLKPDPTAFELGVKLDNLALTDEWNQKKKELVDALRNEFLVALEGQEDADFKAAKLVESSPELAATLRKMDNTASMVNVARKKLLEIIEAAAYPEEAYVSKEMMGRAQEFLALLDDPDYILNNSVEAIYLAAEKMHTNTSLYTIVEGAVTKYGERTRTDFQRASSMDTDVRESWIKKEITGPQEEDIKAMYENIVARNPWVAKDEDAAAFIKRELKAQSDFVVKKSLEDIVKTEKQKNVDARSLGLLVDDKGKIIFEPMSTPWGIKGENGIHYGAHTNGDPYAIELYAGTEMYIKDKGQTLKVTLQDPATMNLRGEYTLKEGRGGILSGRYIDGKVILEQKILYDPDEVVRSQTKKGKTSFVGVPTDTQATTQEAPFVVLDENGNKITIRGRFTAAVSWDDYKSDVRAINPGLQAIHGDLPGIEDIDIHGSQDNPIILDASNTRITIDPNKYYELDGTLYKGDQIE